MTKAGTIDPMLTAALDRLVEVGKSELKPNVTVLAKREEFQRKRLTARNDADKAKYDIYLTCLDWVLNGNHPRPH